MLEVCGGVGVNRLSNRGNALVVLMSDQTGQGKNTDRELWREREGDYYADSIHVTQSGGIGINVGGYVFVKPLSEWHALAGGKAAFQLAASAPQAEDMGVGEDAVAHVMRAILKKWNGAMAAQGHPQIEWAELAARAAIAATASPSPSRAEVLEEAARDCEREAAAHAAYLAARKRLELIP